MRTAALGEHLSKLNGVSYFGFMKLTAIIIFVLGSIFARGIQAGLAIGIFVFPVWLVFEKISTESASTDYWKSNERRSERARLPLKKDVEHIQKAREDKEINQAIIEGRVKKQIYKTLKKEYGLSDEDIKSLEIDPDGLEENVVNEDLHNFLKLARDFEDLTDERDVRISKGDEMDFEEKVKMGIEELEKIHEIRWDDIED